MPRFPIVLVLLLALLSGCDPQETREQKIIAHLPLQDAYEHNITRMAELMAPRFPQVPQGQIDQVLREHLTVEDQRKDLLKLYSEANFTDAEFDLIIAATADPSKAKALDQTEQGRALSDKLTRLMRESARDPQAQARAAQRMEQIERELRQRQQQAAPAP